MKHACSKCGHEDEINPAKMLGSIRTPKKEAAWKKNGEKLKDLYAELRRVKSALANQKAGGAIKVAEAVVDLSRGYPAEAGIWDNAFTATAKKAEQLLVAPKGSFSKEDLKAMIQGGAIRKNIERAGDFGVTVTSDLHETPCAPFDLNLEGEPHRVTQIGKKLALFYLGAGEATFNRYLVPGELEKFWEMRNK